MAYMSEEGYKQLIEELKYLESVERPKIVSAIAEARDKGDLSENAEYDAAKEAQGLLEMKISQLKSTIGDAKIIDTSKMNADTVQILTKVELKNAKTGMKMVYTIVAESDIPNDVFAWAVFPFCGMKNRLRSYSACSPLSLGHQRCGSLI